jgi:hypothetical protein
MARSKKKTIVAQPQMMKIEWINRRMMNWVTMPPVEGYGMLRQESGARAG